MGGVGLILLKDYYMASNLTQLRTWFPQNTRWQELEEFQIPGNNLYNVLMTSRFNTLLTSALSPTIKISLQAWKTLLDMQVGNSSTISL